MATNTQLEEPEKVGKLVFYGCICSSPFFVVGQGRKSENEKQKQNLSPENENKDSHVAQQQEEYSSSETEKTINSEQISIEMPGNTDPSTMQNYTGVVAKTKPKRNTNFTLYQKNILNDWLEKHYYHPYPSDLEKKELTKKTGLTIKQLNTWFVNNRIRNTIISTYNANATCMIKAVLMSNLNAQEKL